MPCLHSRELVTNYQRRNYTLNARLLFKEVLHCSIRGRNERERGKKNSCGVDSFEGICTFHASIARGAIIRKCFEMGDVQIFPPCSTFEFAYVLGHWNVS